MNSINTFPIVFALVLALGIYFFLQQVRIFLECSLNVP
jgi:hypothetical protein